ncbi:MAG TPA: cysteine dioxygenase family protein [Mycobacteriales bacterium]|jgi:predicted metal-dependent enzyme (double-stranded beta helix superfamily)|nr:cysteine dioxygenase family protein [Mycobacteriales bacterium]
MTHQNETFQRVPAHLALDSLPGDRVVRLLVTGQGTVVVTDPDAAAFTVTVAASEARGAEAFRWTVDADGVRLSRRRASRWTDVVDVPGAGIDPDPLCEYWFSIDSHNRALMYGKGEMRLNTKLARYALDAPPKGKADPYAWLAQVETVRVEGGVADAADLWRDPVVVDPPMRVVPDSAMTMEDAATGAVTVAANLTPTCQVLYANVAGPAFTLDTPDFPDFGRAIKESIDDPDGWCYRTLKAKADEFGKPDPQMTYLRITLGLNQGESPGVPFVMEIWPSGHYSPIHNHGGADAVIKVLHGEIHVSLFAMLSPHHTEPFGQVSFAKDEVTWISARLNQVHQLRNDGTEPCITIQCYLYAESNLTHYPYFDYLDQADIGHFDPNSDMDFLAFKQLMRDEQAARARRPLRAAAPVPRPLLVADRVGIRGPVGPAR